MSYQTLFTDYLSAALAESLARVRTSEGTLPETTRRQAWHLLSFALNGADRGQPSTAHALPDTWSQTGALVLALAPKMEQAGFREEWVVYLTAAHQASEARADWWLAAHCELEIGLLYRLMSRFDAAHAWSAASVEHFVALGDILGERRALNELAWLEQLQHNYAEATRHAERALALADQPDVERGMSLRVLGMIANSQRQWQSAQRYHEQALVIFEQQNDQRRIAWSLQNLAVALQEQMAFPQAILLYQRAIGILEALGDSYHTAIVQMNVGRAYYQSGEAEQGLLYLTKAATQFHLMADPLYIARVETNLGICHYARQHYATAADAFLTAIAAYTRLGDQAWKLNAVAGLGMVYVADQQYAQAIQLLEPALVESEQIKAHPYYESIVNYLRQYLAEAKQGQGLKS